MPCYDPRVEELHEETTERNLKQEAIICALCRSLITLGIFDAVIDEIDEVRTGLTKKAILTYIKDHFEHDAEKPKG